MYLKDVIKNLKLKKNLLQLDSERKKSRKNKEEERQRKKGGKNAFRED